ncbi:MAG TPA: GntR family transcriptional regulator [Acidisoma sp.]|nr:GntR family transcriptional regulator [Acidisoma sp.]
MHQVLEQHLLEHRLPAGLILIESTLAEAFRVSRAPVQMALKRLHETGLISRFEGRGYIVPAAEGRAAPPLRISPTQAGLDVSLGADHAEDTARAGWVRIATEVQREIEAAGPFGRFRLSETLMASHFKVSRTVVRDVLGRMHERGLISKDDRSHWLVGPLTDSGLCDMYEARIVLEPAALQQAAATLDRAMLLQMLERVEAARAQLPRVEPALMEQIDHDLHVDCVQNIGNRYLVDLIQRTQASLAASHRLTRLLEWGIESGSITEHALVFEALLQGATEAAAAALKTHLQRSLERARTQLKVISVIAVPGMPDYLVPDPP